MTKSVVESPLFASIDVSSDDLRELLEVCGNCIDKESMRFALGGIKLEADSGQLRGIGTDGRRLAVVEVGQRVTCGTIDTLKQTLSERGGIVDVSPVMRHVRSLPMKTVKVTLSFHRDGVVFTWATTGKRGKQFADECRYIEGRFPNWQQVFPTDDPTGTAIIECNAWVETYNKHIENQRNVWDLSINGKVDAKPYTPEPPVFPKMDHTGDDIDLRVDFSYLMGFLSNTRNKAVELQYHGPHSPLVIDHRLGRYIVMPVSRD